MKTIYLYALKISSSKNYCCNLKAQTFQNELANVDGTNKLTKDSLGEWYKDESDKAINFFDLVNMKPECESRLSLLRGVSDCYTYSLNKKMIDNFELKYFEIENEEMKNDEELQDLPSKRIQKDDVGTNYGLHTENLIESQARDNVFQERYKLETEELPYDEFEMSDNYLFEAEHIENNPLFKAAYEKLFEDFKINIFYIKKNLVLSLSSRYSNNVKEEHSNIENIQKQESMNERYQQKTNLTSKAINCEERCLTMKLKFNQDSKDFKVCNDKSVCTNAQSSILFREKTSSFNFYLSEKQTSFGNFLNYDSDHSDGNFSFNESIENLTNECLELEQKDFNYFMTSKELITYFLNVVSEKFNFEERQWKSNYLRTFEFHLKRIENSINKQKKRSVKYVNQIDKYLCEIIKVIENCNLDEQSMINTVVEDNFPFFVSVRKKLDAKRIIFKNDKKNDRNIYLWLAIVLEEIISEIKKFDFAEIDFYPAIVKEINMIYHFNNNLVEIIALPTIIELQNLSQNDHLCTFILLKVIKYMFYKGISSYSPLIVVCYNFIEILTRRVSVPFREIAFQEKSESKLLNMCFLVERFLLTCNKKTLNEKLSTVKKRVETDLLRSKHILIDIFLSLQTIFVNECLNIRNIQNIEERHSCYYFLVCKIKFYKDNLKKADTSDILKLSLIFYNFIVTKDFSMLFENLCMSL